MTDTVARPMARPTHRWVRSDRVHRNAYLDPGLFAEELDRTINRTWIYVGHESELSRPGDYRTTMIGRQPVIVTRDHLAANQVANRGTRSRASHRR